MTDARAGPPSLRARAYLSLPRPVSARAPAHVCCPRRLFAPRPSPARRHRQPEHWSIAPSFCAFAFCFCTWRLGLGTWGTVHFARHYRAAQPFAPWQGHLTAALLVIGSAFQWYWGVLILRSAARKMWPTETRAKRE